MVTSKSRLSAREILEEIDMRDLAALRQAVEGTEFDSHVIDEIIETHFNDQYDRKTPERRGVPIRRTPE